MTTEINEKSAFVLAFEIRDENDALEVPTTLDYQIDCLTTGAAIRASASITPASSGDIDILPADTTLQSQDNATELRVVTVTQDAGLDSQRIQQFRYEVKNLRVTT